MNAGIFTRLVVRFPNQNVGKLAARSLSHRRSGASVAHRVDFVRRSVTHDRGRVVDYIVYCKNHGVGVCIVLRNFPVKCPALWNGYQVGRGNAVVNGNVILLHFGPLVRVSRDSIVWTSGDS
jgi:hypothetical protein